MQNHNVIKKESVVLRDVNDVINNLDNLLDAIGVEINYHYWDTLGSSFIDIILQCYLIPTGDTTISTLKMGNNLDMFITKDKFAKALTLANLPYRLPTDKDAFTFNAKRYKVNTDIAVNLTNKFDGNIVPLLIIITGIRQTDIKQGVSLR